MYINFQIFFKETFLLIIPFCSFLTEFQCYAFPRIIEEIDGEHQLPKLWENLFQDLTHRIDFLCAAPGKTILATVNRTCFFSVRTLHFAVLLCA